MAISRQRAPLFPGGQAPGGPRRHKICWNVTLLGAGVRVSLHEEGGRKWLQGKVHRVLKSIAKREKCSFSVINFFFKNWRIIALQCCVGFCHTTSWINHNYIYMCMCISIYISPPSWAFLSPPPSCPFWLSQSARLSSLLYSSSPLVIYFTQQCVHMSMLLSQFVPLSPASAVSTRPFSTSDSIPSLQIGSSLLLF